VKTINFKELEELNFEFVGDVESYMIHKEMPDLKLILRWMQNTPTGHHDKYDLKKIMIACFHAGRHNAQKEIRKALGIFKD